MHSIAMEATMEPLDKGAHEARAIEREIMRLRPRNQG
jgi:hypothetical protein